MTKHDDPPRSPESHPSPTFPGSAWALGAEIADLVCSRSPSDPARQMLMELMDGFRARLLDRALADAPKHGAPQPAVTTPAPPRNVPRRNDLAAPAYDRGNPRAARLLSHSELDGGAKLLSFDVESSGIEGRVGDQIALCPRNDPEEVRRILRGFGVRGVEPIQTAQGSSPAWRILLEDVEIRNLSEPLTELFRNRLLTREERSSFDDFVAAARPSLLSTIRRFPKLANKLPEVVRALKPLSPILGHLCEPLGSNPTPLAMILSEHAYETSRTCGLELAPGTWVPIYVESRPAHHLSDDSELPLVLVTDLAAFPLARGYVMERHDRLHRGRTWVFAFGVSQSNTFIGELTGWLESGKLTRFDIVGGPALPSTSGLANERDMLYRWFVDRSAFVILGGDPRRAEQLQASVASMLLEASKKDPAWFEAAREERRENELYRIVSLA